MQQLFPTQLYKSIVREPDSLAGRQLARHFIEQSQRVEGVCQTNVGGWHSPALLQGELVDIPGGLHLVVLIQQALRTLSGHALFDGFGGVWPDSEQLPDYLKVWGNVMRAGDYHLTHCHLQCQLAGVFYCAIHDEDPGLLQLDDPRSPTIEGTHRALCRPPSLQVPQQGQLLIFPAWLRHSVLPFTHDQRRVSVAFNVLFNKP